MSLRNSRLLAEISFHRTLERAHGELAQSLAAEVGEDVLELPSLRGLIQRRIAGLPRMATIEGMTASQVAKELEHDDGNTHTSLVSLEKNGTIELIEGSNPRRWRLTETQRRNRVLRLSRLIPAGGWTTYGEFAIAVYGSPLMAITIGQAAKSAAFANPHRVLHAGGVIDKGWRDLDGGGPEQCRRLLEGEGVWRAKADAANQRYFLNWEALADLLKTDEELDQPR